MCLRKDKEGIEQDIQDVYEMFPVLEIRRNQSAGTLSGGEQQMLAIARSLMARPSLFLLDEPSTGLALLVKAAISEKIKEIQKRGVTMLLVEQDIQMAFHVAQRVYVVEQGKIVLEGDVKDIESNHYVEEAYLGLA